MNTAVLGFYEPERRSDAFRWSVAAFVVLALHLAILAAYLVFRPEGDQAQAPLIAIEVAPAPVEPPAAAAVAPEMVPSPPEEQELPPPQPQSPPDTQAMVTPSPESEQPTVELPPPPKPAPMKPPKERRAHAPEQRHIKAEHEPRQKSSTASRTQPSRAASAPTSGAASLGSKEAEASWRSRLAAHIARYKRYPPAAEAHHDTGTVRLSFTMDRNGRVLSRHIAGSSGSATLDQEVLSMIERAQPLPAFPPSMPQTRMTLAIPIHFSMR